MREAGAGDELVGGCEVAQHLQVFGGRPRRQRRQAGFGEHAHGHHDVGVGLIGQVEHGIALGPPAGTAGTKVATDVALDRLHPGSTAAQAAVPAPPKRQGMQLSHHHQQSTQMPKATLSISSKNYSSWSLRGWLLCKLAGLDVEEELVSLDDPSTRAELLLLSPSFLVPCLTHDGVRVWDTLAIGEYLDETFPKAGLLPDRARGARALPGDLRRDALGLLQSPLGPADEPEGPSSGLQGVGRGAGRHRPRDGNLA